MKNFIGAFEPSSIEFCSMQYDEAKKYAQNDKWLDHLSVIKPIIVIYHQYCKKNRVARCLCRGAWSHIALKDYHNADAWLSVALEEDKEEALAGIYWAIEYSKRFGIVEQSYTKKWSETFQKQVKTFLEDKGVESLEGLNFADLTIAFYEFLSRKKSASQSDIARYHELQARHTKQTSEEKIASFTTAARHYSIGKLKKYENFCHLCAGLESLRCAKEKKVEEAAKQINTFIEKSLPLSCNSKLDRTSSNVLNAICDLNIICQQETPKERLSQDLIDTLLDNPVLSKDGVSTANSLLNHLHHNVPDPRIVTEHIFDLLTDFYASILRIY